jgi:hypothetical protein
MAADFFNGSDRAAGAWRLTGMGERIMQIVARRSSWLRAVGAAALTALVAGVCAAQPMAQPPGAAPIPSGQARVWFYRVFFPEDTGGMPPVSMNGAIVGYARAGYTFYRDVPAGAYYVSVQSVGSDTDQTKNIVLAPGAQAYLVIQSDPTWLSERVGSRQPTYYVGVEPPHIAAIHLSQMQVGNGY